MKHSISSRADYPASDRNFPRQREDWRHVRLEPTPAPIKSWGVDIIAGVVLVLAMIAAIWLPDFLVWWFQ